MHVFWDGVPPSAPRVSIQVFWVKVGEPAFLRLLGNAQGVWVHWVEGRTLPCHTQDCPWCLGGLAQRWKGYVPALWSKAEKNPTVDAKGKVAFKREWVPVVLEITESMVGQLPDRLRGLVVELNRRGKRANSPVDVKVLEHSGTHELPPAFEVRPILERMWGVRKLVRPAQQEAETAEAARPTIPFRRRAEGGAS